MIAAWGLLAGTCWGNVPAPDIPDGPKAEITARPEVIQATGSGRDLYAEDISQWNDLRRVPAMQMYFDHMNTYPISYAAFPENEDTTS